MGSSERDIAQFLRDLHSRLEEVSGDREALRRAQADLAARERDVAKEWEKRESAKLKELERRTDLLMEKFERQARETIDQIHAGAGERKAAEQALRRVAKTKREFLEEVRSEALSTSDESRQGALLTPRIEPGARVRLKGVREPATITRKLAAGIIEVQAGFMKMQVPADDVLEVLPGAGEGARLPQNVTFTPGPSWNVSSRELNVIGRRAEEATAEVDKFLDSAAMASIDRVRIIHGHGMGILKKAIAELLKNHPQVSKYYAASPAEGGTGATIAELK
jgi:DNA mismatch repair protein MutS2